MSERAYGRLLDKCEKLEAEIAQLRAHMRALADTSVDRDTAGIFKGLWRGSEKECDELRAEIERLRHELEVVQCLVEGTTVEQMRAALRFYAEAAVVTPAPGRPGCCDDGWLARAALEHKRK